MAICTKWRFLYCINCTKWSFLNKSAYTIYIFLIQQEKNKNNKYSLVDTNEFIYL